MAQNKTQPTDVSPKAFIESLDEGLQQDESFFLLDWMKKITGIEPVMWGTSIIGFGEYHYKYESGREGDMIRVGFSPRKGKHTIYILPGFSKYEEILSRLGKHKTGKSCLYIKKLEDIDMDVLEELIRESLAFMAKKYPE